MEIRQKFKELLQRRWLKKMLLACGSLVLLIAAGLLIDYAYYLHRLYPGIMLETIPLGKMRLEEAEAYLEAEIWSLEHYYLSTGEENFTYSLQELGISWDKQETMERLYRAGRGWKGYWVRLRSWIHNEPIVTSGAIIVDEFKLASVMAALGKQIYSPPRDASFRVEGETVEIIAEQEGRYLKAADLRKAILTSLYSKTRELTIPVGRWPAARTAADLESYGVRQLMASFYTDVAPGNPDRAHNIRLGAAAINGTLLAPGEIFSFSEIVGETTMEKGYRYAPIIVGDELVPGLGGGLCQVSTTLYNAALYANLEIIERYNHSMSISYIPLGRDATVSIGSLDLKFKNSRDHYILIGADLNNLRLTFRIFGPPMVEKVEIVSSGYRQVAPPEKYEYTDELPEGEKELVKAGQSGHYITTWRIVTRDGVEISREMLSTDYYRPQPAVYLVGTGD